MTPTDLTAKARKAAIDLSVFAGYERLDEWAASPDGSELLRWVCEYLLAAEQVLDLLSHVYHHPSCQYRRPNRYVAGHPLHPCSCTLIRHLEAAPAGLLEQHILDRVLRVGIHDPNTKPAEWLERDR